MPRKIEYTVPAEYSNRPAIHFLREYAELSVSICKHIRNTENALLVNGVHTRVIDKLYEGDKVEIFIPEKTKAPLLCDAPISIIYEDEDLLIVNKPYGISVNPTRNHPNGTLCNMVASYIYNTQGVVSAARAVGRLDKVTSGVMVFAKNSYSASLLNGNMDKTYNAIVTGELKDSGTIDAPIYRPDPRKTERCVDPKGDKAVTHWKALKSFNNKTFAEIKTETGRTHQIRVHFSHTGHPLVGDDMYGGKPTNYVHRTALHCKEITMTHPVTLKTMTFTAPLPDDMRSELDEWEYLEYLQNTEFLDKTDK